MGPAFRRAYLLSAEFAEARRSESVGTPELRVLRAPRIAPAFVGRTFCPRRARRARRSECIGQPELRVLRSPRIVPALVGRTFCPRSARGRGDQNPSGSPRTPRSPRMCSPRIVVCGLPTSHPFLVAPEGEPFMAQSKPWSYRGVRDQNPLGSQRTPRPPRAPRIDLAFLRRNSLRRFRRRAVMARSNPGVTARRGDQNPLGS